MSEVEWLKIFGENLSEILEEQNMTQKELADATGLSRGAINGYVNGAKMPGVRAIINMVYVLGVDINDFIDFGDMID